MRIIGGSAGGTILQVPKGYDVRPTPDLVRQAVFNSLGERVVNARVLDLFSGTGALGLECLSRGANFVLSIEKVPGHAHVLRQNADAAHLSGPAHEIRVQEVVAALKQLAEQAAGFDLVIADPPFGEKNIGRRSTSLSQQLLDNSALPALLHPDGIFVLGHTKRDTLEVPARWRELRVLKHGDSMMRFLRRNEPPPCSGTG